MMLGSADHVTESIQYLLLVKVYAVLDSLIDCAFCIMFEERNGITDEKGGAKYMKVVEVGKPMRTKSTCLKII